MKTPISTLDIYNILKSAIVNLEYLPSTKLSENEIACKYGISRTPVKAAFTRLENEGFVTVLPQRGTFVSLLDLEKITEILYMRFVLEKDIAEKFIKIATENDISKMNHTINAQSKLISKNGFTPEQFYNLDLAFHGFMFEKTGHKLLWEELLKLQVNYARFRMLYIVRTDKFNELIKEHEILLNALALREPDIYIQALDEHLNRNLKIIHEITDADNKKYFKQTGGGNE